MAMHQYGKHPGAYCQRAIEEQIKNHCLIISTFFNALLVAVGLGLLGILLTGIVVAAAIKALEKASEKLNGK
jgi:hypothetical protein